MHASLLLFQALCLLLLWAVTGSSSELNLQKQPLGPCPCTIPTLDGSLHFASQEDLMQNGGSREGRDSVHIVSPLVHFFFSFF